MESRVFDCTFLDLDELRDELREYAPDVVGLSVMVGLTAATIRVADLVRATLPHALLIAGGPLPTVFPRRFLPWVDAVFRGEADLSFPRFCRDLAYLAAGPRDLQRLPLATYAGLFMRHDGRTVDNPPAHHSEAEIARFPMPDRRDVDHAAYQLAWRQKTGHCTTSIMVTFGCPYACDFCSKPVFGNEVRRRPLGAVLAEIRRLRELGYDGLWIGDDLFTLDESYLADFCRGIRRMGMTWSCLSRANGMALRTARLMRQSGCERVYLGLESGSQATLDLMNKRLTVAQGVRSVALYKAAGMEVGAFFIVGYPGETVASIERTFALALELPLDDISFNVPMPLPGSALFDRLGRPDEGRDWTHENELTFVYPSGIDEAWLRRRVDETMTAFAAKRAKAVTSAGAAVGL